MRTPLLLALLVLPAAATCSTRDPDPDPQPIHIGAMWQGMSQGMSQGMAQGLALAMLPSVDTNDVDTGSTPWSRSFARMFDAVEAGDAASVSDAFALGIELCGAGAPSAGDPLALDDELCALISTQPEHAAAAAKLWKLIGTDTIAFPQIGPVSGHYGLFDDPGLPDRHTLALASCMILTLINERGPGGTPASMLITHAGADSRLADDPDDLYVLGLDYQEATFACRIADPPDGGAAALELKICVGAGVPLPVMTQGELARRQRIIRARMCADAEDCAFDIAGWCREPPGTFAGSECEAVADGAVYSYNIRCLAGGQAGAGPGSSAPGGSPEADPDDGVAEVTVYMRSEDAAGWDEP